MQRILIVDDKASLRFLLSGYLEDAGYATLRAAGGAEALRFLRDESIDLVLTDIVMPEMTGIELLRNIRSTHPDLPVVLVTAHGCLDSAIAGIREGATDYLLKPLHREMLLLVVARLLEHSRLRHDFSLMLREEQRRFSLETLASRAPAMRAVLEQARQVAASRRTSVAIAGESSVGKEILARAIHLSSGLPLAKFVTVNCAGAPETLIDSDLFGHVRGAFTGAQYEREGKCSLARGGTLFLDEIGDMPPVLQPKLLRLLDLGEFERLGSNQVRSTDCRIITATHQDLTALCAEGRFREDLFHRMNIFPLTIPPLRERREDIPLLVERLLVRQDSDRATPKVSVTPRAMRMLMEHDWPGNVRELRNCLEYALVMSAGKDIQPEHLRISPATSQPIQVNEREVSLNFQFSREEFSLDAVIQRCLQWSLEQTGHNKSSAARLLKTTRKLFYGARHSSDSETGISL